MRCLDRNKKPFYYANYQGMVKLYDNNLFTGEYQLSYSEPVLAYGNISPARGDAYTSPFGISDIGIDKVIVLSDPNFPITETSVLWVEKAVTDAYDYTVVRIARSINSISIAIKKVDVDVTQNSR